MKNVILSIALLANAFVFAQDWKQHLSSQGHLGHYAEVNGEYVKGETTRKATALIKGFDQPVHKNGYLVVTIFVDGEIVQSHLTRRNVSDYVLLDKKHVEAIFMGGPMDVSIIVPENAEHLFEGAKRKHHTIVIDGGELFSDYRGTFSFTFTSIPRSI